ncbi:MAG: NAD(P)/FAD-dependent oxidoreductase [archaeon]
MRINIIGAGPAGTYLGYLLAQKGHIVKIFERDREIGKPVQCTGILSDYFKKLMMPQEDFVLNTVDTTRIYAPNREFVDTKIKKNYVICRKKFDSYLAKEAEEAGAKIFLEHSFKSFARKGNRIITIVSHNGKPTIYECDILIGADGPLSEVAKSAGLFGKRKFLIGTQIEASKSNDNVVEFYPYIGNYAWIVPVNSNTVRIGVAAYKSSQDLFKKFAKEKLGEYSKITLENQSGVIPVFDPFVKVQAGNVYLIGDAATFNKATSGGGINQALKAAVILSDCIENNLDYNLEWKRHLFLELYLHLTLHRMMTRFKESDWNNLIRSFSEEKMKSILFSESRDKLFKMCIKIGYTKPSLLTYIRFLL